MGSLGTGGLKQSALDDYEHPVGVEQFRKLGYEVIDMICDYMNTSKTVKVVPDVQPEYLRPLLPDGPPQQPEPWQDIKADFYSKILKGALHWQSSNFFAWFAGNRSGPSMLAEMLMGALNMIGFSWRSSPVSTELEMVMLDWLAKLCGLPDKFINNGASNKAGGGCIQSTSSEAVLVAMLAARARAMEGQPAEAALKLVAYGSDQAHSCFKKAAMVCGLQHVRILRASEQLDYGLDPQHLAARVQEDKSAGLIPFYLCGTVGTTSSCAVDPIGALAAVCKQHNIWFHVDAAWAGSASIVPEQRHWFEGLSDADSYSFSVHKWLMTNFDCAAMWFDDTRYLKKALALTPLYLQATGNIFDYKDWQIPLGRRFRSLKLWFVMRMYGAEKLQNMIRHHIALGEWFAQQASTDPRFEVAAPPRFGLTCYRLKGVGDDGNKKLVERINAEGTIFQMGTELHGQFTLRFAVGNADTQLQHVQRAWEIIKQQAEQLLAESSMQAEAAAAMQNGHH